MKMIFRPVIPIILVTGFSACGNLNIRPLKEIPDDYACHGDPDNGRTVYSPIEERLIRQAALKSRKINLESGIGMLEKTVRLFVLDRSEVRLVFHFMHPIDLDIDDFGFAIQGDTGVLASGEMEVDHRVAVGGMVEEHAHLIYPADKLARLLDDKEVSITVGDMRFGIPFGCREAFREIRDKNASR